MKDKLTRVVLADTLTLVMILITYSGIPNPKMTVRKYVSMMMLLVLNSLMFICVESARKNEAIIITTFGAMSIPYQ